MAAQVTTTIAYKAAMWYHYSAEYNPAVKEWRMFSFWHWLSEAFWVEFAIDALTVYLFVSATWRLFGLFA